MSEERTQPSSEEQLQVEPQAQVEEQQQQPTPGLDPGGQPQPEPERQDWRDRRLGEQQARLRQRNQEIADLQAREAELRARLAQYEHGQPGQPPGQNPGGYQQQPAYPQQPQNFQQYQRDVQAAVEEQRFLDRCNEVAAQARQIYPDFNQRVQQLAGLYDQNDNAQKQMYNQFLKGCLATGQAARLVYELGGNLDEAARILALEPTTQGVELGKMAAERGRNPETSMAPRPLSPIASATQANRTTIAPDDPEGADTLDISEWMKRRDEQVTTRRQRTIG